MKETSNHWRPDLLPQWCLCLCGTYRGSLSLRLCWKSLFWPKPGSFSKPNQAENSIKIKWTFLPVSLCGTKPWRQTALSCNNDLSWSWHDYWGHQYIHSYIEVSCFHMWPMFYYYCFQQDNLPPTDFCFVMIYHSQTLVVYLYEICDYSLTFVNTLSFRYWL